MARTKNSGSDVLSIKSAKHKSVSGDTKNANNVKSAKKNAKAAKRSSSSTATSASGHRLGVAAVALASTLSMVLPGAAALARTSFNPDSFDPSYVNSVAKTSGKGAGNGDGKGSGNGKDDGNGLYKNGLLNTGAPSDRTTRHMFDSVKYLAKNTDSNSIAEGAENQETVAGDSSVGVKDYGEYFVTNGDSSSTSNRSFDTNNFEDRSATNSADNSATKTATKSEQGTASSEITKPVKSAKKSDAKHTNAEQTNPAETGKVAEKPKSNASVHAHKTTEKPTAAKPKVENSVKPADTKASYTKPAATNPDAVKPAAAPAAKQSAQPETSQPASAKTVAKTEPEAKAEPNQNTAQTEHAENQQPAIEQNTNAQPSSTHEENANTVNDANKPKVRSRRSVDESANGSNKGSSVTPASNAPETPSASAPSAGTESSAGAGNTASPSAEGNGNAQGGQGAQGQSAENPTAQGTAQGSHDNTQGAVTGTGVTGKDKSATPSPASPASTPTAGTQNTGTTTNNAATDPNSQVIKPNTDNPEAKSTEQANEQVQTDKKPKATYNLQIRYTIGGAANKQLVQPYELTIDKAGFDNLGKDGKYEYIELPKSAGYRPSVYHSGTYQYYIKNDKNEFVIDDGTNADAVRYLRLDKNLIKEYAVKKRQAVGGNNVAQAPQTSSSQTTTNPQSSSSTQMPAEDGIQYYGELNINYAPKTAKYYVRHLVQDLDNKDKFIDAPNLGIGKVITVTHKDGTSENIHVTEITGTVGSDVTAVSTYIPGYEPEHNLISSPLSDSEDEKDKLVLNLRYYRKAYEVTYDSDGGTDVTAQKVYYQQDVPQVTNPTRRGYTFKGWSLVDPNQKSDPLYAENTIVSLDDYKMPDHNVQFRANWEANNTTSYRVNVWVQKADLVDKDNPNSLKNYDFVGLVERKNVKTDSDVALNNMNDAGVANDTNKLNGENEDNYVKNPELGLTKEELQGKDSDHKTGLISKFNWMNDTPVTSLDGYNTANPGAAENKGKDIFTRYFHVNKELTKKLNTEQHDFVPGRPDLGKRSKSQLCADDLNNTLNLVYDRNTYELIFAKPAGIKNDSLNNAAIKRKDENGKTTIYCYAGGGNCSDEYDDKNEDDSDNAINHKGYRVNVRYGQRLTDIWPDVNELDFNKENTGSLGWTLGYAGDGRRCYRDTPPYRFTKKEFADPSLRVDLKNGAGIAPKISDDPDNAPNNTYELKDNQRLLTADTNSKSTPIQVIIRKQSIASAKNSGDDIDDNDYELSTDSYSKDDTDNPGYLYTAPSIAGFNPADGYDKTKVGDDLDEGDFAENLEEWYNESHAHGDWNALSEDEQKAFAKKYHLEFRKFRGVPVDEQENYESDDVTEFETNKQLEFRYDRQSYDVQFYNADGNAIKDGSGAATERLPFEYSLTKRGNAKLTGEDADLYYNKGAVKSYDASVTKDGGNNTATQFDGKYTFTLNGKTYSIVRPADLPEDYVFKGWAVDQAGTQFINGENKDITMPVNGIKLYAAWGKPTNIKHTVTLDYHMPGTDENGNTIQDVVKKKEFARYNVIDEKNDIKVPTRKGYDFYGWEITKNGKTLPYAFGNKVVEDIKLDAVWVRDTRYNGTFKHIFLKPGYTFDEYKQPGLSESAKAAMVDHVSTQTVSGLREHLRYNAEAVYSDETHFPDKHFTSFEASSDEKQNTGEFIYQTYNTRKYKVKYIDQNGKDLLPESEVSSVNRNYDVAFYKPIEGFMPETTQKNIIYTTDREGKQTNGIPTITFKYKDVRVLKRQDDNQSRPTNYTRYVFKVADNQSSMGSVVDWQNKDVADGSALVYDAIKGTKAYQMPLPTVKAKQGYEFDGWTSQIGSYDAGSTKLQYADGVSRLPIRSEEQNSPEVIYTAKFKLKAPVAAAPQVLKPTENISIANSDDAKKLITNAGDYPDGAKFSFADGEKFDNTPGLHKIKVQVKLGDNSAEAEVLYRVLPDLVYASDWEKFKATDYGKAHIDEYAPITFTGKNDEGTIVGHDGDNANHPAGGETTLTAYVYKGKEVRIRVPQAFGKDHGQDNYYYVFKGWATKVVEPTAENPNPEQKYDIDPEGRYKDVTVDDNSGKTYTAVYKKIEYFSSTSDGGEVPKDAVVAIFKPAPGRLWKDGTSGPKVFYVKKGTDLEKITKEGSGALAWLNNQLTGAKGTWSRSSMLNDGKKVDSIPNVADSTDKWKVNEPFQEFVADQEPLATPEVKSNTLLAIRGDKETLPEPKDYIANYDSLIDKTKNPNVKSVTVKYASTAPTIDKAGVYTVPLTVSVTYSDADTVDYKTVGKLKVMYDLIYGENVKDLGNKPTQDEQSEHDQIANEYKKVNFITNNSYGTMASGSRTLFYAHTGKTSGVRAPQAIGKDYDADGYHYEFVGWKKLDDFTQDNSSAKPLTADKVKQNEILQSSSILKNAYKDDTTYQAVYKRVENVIDASKQDEIPDGYVATIFLPGFGRTWADGSYKPKLLYIRHGKDKEDNIKFAKKVASDTAATLSGFTKWQMYNARGDKSNIFLHDNWDISKPRIFVAEQNGVDDVKIPETVIGVGESITNVNKLVHNTDPKVSVSIDSNSTVDVSKPGISTIMVNVTKPIDETDSVGKQKTVTTKLPVRVYVLPNVIADNDLPAKGTAAAKFIEKNYTKVTYVAGKGGSLQKSPLKNAGSEPVSVYWVRNDAKGFLMQVPDVLADKGYVFKNWTSITTETPAVPADKRKATEEEREALARLAKIDGMHYVAKLISDSRNSTLAALQNLLNEAQKQHAAQVYNAKREELAKIAESKGKIDLASEIRKSNDSLQNIKNNMLIKEGIDVDEIVEHNREKALLAKIAKEAGNETLAEEISKSNDSLDDLSKKLEKAGIDLAEYNKLTFDKKKEALAQFADINGLHYVASIIRASHKSSLEAFKNLIKSAKPDVKIPAYKVNEEDYASEEQRELLIQIAEEKERPDIAAKIRLLHSSTLQDLKKLFKDAGVDLYAIPAAKPKHEITITANFEKMAPMKFKFSGSAREGILTNFRLQNMTEGDVNNTTVTVDGKTLTINELVAQGLTSVNGINANCAGTECKISGTPKIVDGKPKVELTFTTTDKYGREAEITVEIDVISESKPAPTPVLPAPTPAPSKPEEEPRQEEYPMPESYPYILMPESPLTEVVPEQATEPKQKTEPEAVKDSAKQPSEALPQTGSDVTQSALIASLLASVGLAGFAAKHRRRKNEDNES
ncbi:InlB B-repeat-containing protein [Gardnerella vaginalis]|uniref:InlB B-repeat-containing protein n=1 Tax=Gardnerella vaginalis TaxID=2702 RepID=UPI003970EA12